MGIRRVIESILYAGLKPDQRPSQPKAAGAWRRVTDRFLSGAPPDDPLYLTNRTLTQKLMVPLAVGVPCLILAVWIGNALTSEKTTRPPNDPTPQEIAAKMLPLNLGKDRVDTNKDVTVTEIRLEHNKQGDAVSAIIRNKTGHEIRSADIVFDLTDGAGSGIGGVRGRVEAIPAGGTKTMKVPIEQRNAAFVLVREIQIQ